MVTSKHYTIGSRVRITITITDIDGNLVNPDYMSFYYHGPDKQIVEYELHVDDEIVWDSDGTYHVDLDLDEVGTHRYLVHPKGAVKGSATSSLVVQKSPFSVKFEEEEENGEED